MPAFIASKCVRCSGVSACPSPASAKKKSLVSARETNQAASTKSERSESDSVAAMGYATTRTSERVAAAMGLLASAPVQFQAACDVPKGGVLLALPALVAVGLLRHTAALYTLPNGFYGIASIFLRGPRQRRLAAAGPGFADFRRLST
jgi:hypothetical protein